MGIYPNPGNRGFWESARSEIYVDKTGLIAETNKCVGTEQKFLCVSRPRCFGKSMALKMLAAYYSRGCDSEELSAVYSIAENPTYKEYLNRYDVVFLHMQQFLTEAAPGRVTEYLEREMLEEYVGEILAVGINYDRDNVDKPHSCVIEKMEKQ